MMGRESSKQPQLFYTGINLEKRIRKNHPLRRIEALLDLSFISERVKECYGFNGNVSVPPAVIVKLMLLLVFYNVRSERELMDTVSERLDWLWFLGYDIDWETPNHSVLSKARQRWGVEVFREIFERVVWQCTKAGLVDGRKIFVDASLVDANASNNSVVDRESLKWQVHKGYAELEARLEERDDQDGNGGHGGGMNERYVSTTDLDASVVRQGGCKSKLRYKSHRVVDNARRVITATEITTGAVNEGQRLIAGIDGHHGNTGRSAEVVVADSKYGTKENYFACHDRGIAAHIPDLKRIQDKGERRAGIFSAEAFSYEEETDTYICPGGNRLKRRSHHKGRGSSDYGISDKVCSACSLKAQCTTSKSGRTVHRDYRQEVLDAMRGKARSAEARADLKVRQFWMEGSFGNATRYGFKRARWRGLERVRIQDYLIASVQNMMILIEHGTRKLAEVVALEARRAYCAAKYARLMNVVSEICCRWSFRLAHEAR